MSLISSEARGVHSKIPICSQHKAGSLEFEHVCAV